MRKQKPKKSTFERLAQGEANRRQRRELKRRLYSEDPGLELVHPDAAGIDIGNESHFVAVAPGRDTQPVREFGSWTSDLNCMAEWLKSCGIRTVAMQSTGVYWFAVYDVLEQHGLEVFLVNAHHTKNLPGRKTDVQESQWLLKLHTCGLLRNSFRPLEQIRKLRTIWRLRDRHVKEASRSIQHMQKALTSMNVHWQEDLLLELEQAVAAYDFVQKQLEECDRRLQTYLTAMPSRVMAENNGGDKPATPPAGERGTGGKKKKRIPSRNAPKSFDLAAELKRICGVDATRIEGVDVMTVQTIVAELGADLQSYWPSENHFASWLKLSPQRDISGGKVIRHTRETSRNRVAAMLRMAATTLLRSDSYLGARYRALRTKLGAAKAVKAMARHLACLIYRLFTKGQEWVDRGSQNFERKCEEREKAALQRKATALGLKLVAA